MRVIGGNKRGARLQAPKGLGTRPTTDRTRESLFNILSNKIDFEGAIVIDLFAGSGALGIESLSRGAEFCVFIEKAHPAYSAIVDNISALGLQEHALVLRHDATRLTSHVCGDGKFDLAFADPPYGRGLGEKAAASLVENGLLNRNALFVLEEDTASLPEKLNGFDRIDVRRFGDTSIGMFQFVE